MPDFSRTRSEYLRIMMGEQLNSGFSPDAINDVNDGSFDAAAMANVITQNALKPQQTQTAFDGSRPIGEAASTEEQEKAGFGEFMGNVTHSTMEGFFNTVDALGDALLGLLGGLFGGGWFGAENALTDWTQSAIQNEEWKDQSVRAISSLAYVFTDDFWTNENGFWTDWRHENTLALNEQHYRGQELVRKIGNFAGEMVPQAALAVATGGSSFAVQLATQTAMGFSRQFGASLEQALNEGATFQEASAYGAISGGVEAAFSAASVGLGGFLASKGSQGFITRASQEVGKYVGRAFGSTALQTAAGTATSIVLNSVEEAGEEVIADMLDPVFRQIYDDQAIYNAYGTPENTKDYLESVGEAALMAAAGAAIMGVGGEVINLGRAGGRQGYIDNYLREVETSDNFRYIRQYDRDNGTSYARDYVRAMRAEADIAAQNETLKGELERMAKRGESIEAITAYQQRETARIAGLADNYAARYQSVFDDTSRIIKSRNEAQTDNRGTGLGVRRQTNLENDLEGNELPRADTTPAIPTGNPMVENEYIDTLEPIRTVSEPETVRVPRIYRTTIDGTESDYTDVFNGDQLRAALADSAEDAPDYVKLPIKEDIASDPVYINKRALSDIEKERIAEVTPSDIKQEGVYRYFDLSDEHIVLLDGDNGVKTKVADTEDGYRVFEFDDRRVELPHSEYEPERTPLEEVQARYGADVGDANPSIIIEAANAKRGQTYSYNRTRSMVQDIEAYVRQMLSEGELPEPYRQAFNINSKEQGDITRQVFAQLNLSKNPDLTEQVRGYLTNRVLDQDVRYSDVDGADEHYKLKDLLTTDEQAEVTAKLNETFDELLANGRTSRFQEMEDSLQNRIDNLIRQNTLVRERARIIATSNKLVNVLRRKLGTTAQPGTVARILRNGSDADVDAVNVFRTLLSDVRVLSRTGLTLSPKGLNDLIAFNSQYTIDKFGESMFWSPDIKSELDYMQSFANDNGRFNENYPVPTEAMNAVNNFLKFINHQLTENSIRTYERNRQYANDAAKTVNFIPAGTQTLLGRLISSAENLPTYLKTYLGEENPAYDRIVTDQIKADGAMLHQLQKSIDEIKAVFDAEGTTQRQFHRAMNRRVEFKGQKYTQGELLSAYFSARTKDGIADGTNTMVFANRKGNYSRRLTLELGDIDNLRAAIDPDVLRVAERLQKDVLAGSLSKDFAKAFRRKNGFDPVVSSDYYTLTGDSSMVDISNARNALGSNYAMSNTWRSERSRNASYKGDYRINGFEETLNAYARELARYIGYGDYNENIRVLFNTKIDVDGNGRKRSFGDLMREKAPNWAPNKQNKGKGWFNFFQERVTGSNSNDRDGLLGALMRGGQGAVLGLNPRSMAKQFLSDFTVLGDVGFNTWLAAKPRAARNLAHYAEVRKFLIGASDEFSPLDPDYEDYAPYFALIKDRFQNQGAVRGEISSNAMDTATGKIADFTMKGMSFFDEANNVINVWSVAETMAKQYNGLAYNTKENKVQAMKYFVDLVLRTQSNNNAFYVSRLRSGYNGQWSKLLFGLFGSDNQNRLQQFDLLIRGKRQAEARRAAYEGIISNPNSGEADIQLARSMISKLDANWRGRNYSRRVTGSIASLAFNAIGIAAIDWIFDRVLAKDDRTFKDANLQEDGIELLTDAGYSLINWLPYFGEFVDAFRNGYDMSVFPLDRLNEFISVTKEFNNALQDGSKARIAKATTALFMTLTEVFGIPADNVYKYIKGITRNIDEGSYVYAFKWTEGFTNGQLNLYYNEAVKDKRLSDAISALSTNYAFYKTGVSNDKTIKEVARLSSLGYNAIAKNTPEYYTDEDGERHDLTSAQVSRFKSLYAEAEDEVRSLLSDYRYNRLSDEGKAKAIKRIYDAYYEYARAEVLGGEPTSRLSQLIAVSNGSLSSVSRIASLMQRASEVEPTDTRSKKEQVLAMLESEPGLSSGLRLAIMALLGYSIPEGSEERALSYLRSLGMQNAEAKAFLRVE